MWGNTGLLHDFDYERWPNAPDHPTQGMRILEERGSPARNDPSRSAATRTTSNIPRDTPLSKTLFACDELCGFLTACAYVKPSRKIADVEVSSVKKKLKDKAFARSVSRDDIAQGVEELGIPIDEHIQNCIIAMSRVADELGL